MKLIKIPFSAGSLKKNEGCKNAPDAIISRMHDLFLNENGRDETIDVETVDVSNSDIKLSHKNIETKVSGLNLNSEKTVLVGGDHSITYPAFKAFSSKFQNPGLIVFDAHPDCCHNLEIPSHEDYLRSLIEQGFLKPQNVLIIGLRNWDKDEVDYLKAKKIKTITMKDFVLEGMNEIVERILVFAQSVEGIYLSIDVDACDPAFAPGTGYNEPAGLTSREFIHLIQRTRLLKNLKLVDLVEINPDKDVADLTTTLGAKIVKEIL